MAEIYHVRGDTETIRLQFLTNGEETPPKIFAAGDLFTLTLRNVVTGNVVLQKQIAWPESDFMLSHEDTADLNFATYDYDIEYRKPDLSIVKTIVVGKYTIGKEVTY